MSIAVYPAAERLLTWQAVAEHLALLLRVDSRLSPISEATGAIAPRIREPGFAGLARIVCGQKISVASADAAWARLQALPAGTTPEGFLALSEKESSEIGLTRGKYRTLASLAEAIVAGRLDLAALGQWPAEEAIAALTAYKGIGPWTAEIYMMFCAGHPDVFPAGDLALQRAVGEAFGISPCPDRHALAAIAAGWVPHRTTAALLFWRFYAIRQGREGVAL